MYIRETNEDGKRVQLLLQRNPQTGAFNRARLTTVNEDQSPIAKECLRSGLESYRHSIPATALLRRQIADLRRLDQFCFHLSDKKLFKLYKQSQAYREGKKAAKENKTFQSYKENARQMSKSAKIAVCLRENIPEFSRYLRIVVDGEMHALEFRDINMANDVLARAVEQELLNSKWYVVIDYSEPLGDRPFACKQSVSYTSFFRREVTDKHPKPIHEQYPTGPNQTGYLRIKEVGWGELLEYQRGILMAQMRENPNEFRRKLFCENETDRLKMKVRKGREVITPLYYKACNPIFESQSCWRIARALDRSDGSEEECYHAVAPQLRRAALGALEGKTSKIAWNDIPKEERLRLMLTILGALNREEPFTGPQNAAKRLKEYFEELRSSQ